MTLTSALYTHTQQTSCISCHCGKFCKYTVDELLMIHSGMNILYVMPLTSVDWSTNLPLFLGSDLS